jgi:hypothetical protein
MRQCLETRSLDRLGERLDQLEGSRAEGVSYVAKDDQPHHVAHWELAERLTPERGLITIIGGNEAGCRRRLEEIDAAGKRAGRHVKGRKHK